MLLHVIETLTALLVDVFLTTGIDVSFILILFVVLLLTLLLVFSGSKLFWGCVVKYFSTSIDNFSRVLHAFSLFLISSISKNLVTSGAFFFLIFGLFLFLFLNLLRVWWPVKVSFGYVDEFRVFCDDGHPSAGSTADDGELPHIVE
jgi:hypothetical protein